MQAVYAEALHTTCKALRTILHRSVTLVRGVVLLETRAIDVADY